MQYIIDAAKFILCVTPVLLAAFGVLFGITYSLNELTGFAMVGGLLVTLVFLILMTAILFYMVDNA